MPNSSLDRTQIPLFELAWPVLVENVLRTSLMSVDTFMLSRYSEKAVAAMSLVGQFAFFIQLLYLMVAIGASILISQNLGAGRRSEAGLVGVGSLVLMVVVSLFLSAAVVVMTGPVVGLFHLDSTVALYCRQFLILYGGLSFFMAINIAQASILRAWGHPRDPMLVNAIALLLTLAGNALCLFGLFGFPVLGVVGVAGSTVASQVVACIVFFFMIRKRKQIALPLRQITRIPRRVYRAVLAVGVPTVGENLAYNTSQIVILSMIANMGTDALATYGILLAVLRYVFIPGISIGAGAQIKVGYLVGAGRPEQAVNRVYRYFAVGFAISLVAITFINLLRAPIFDLFSVDAKVLALAGSVLWVAQIHEPARNFNTIIIPALKGAGDVRFPVYVGIVSMWGVGVFGAWVLGVWLGLGLVGVWIALASDEWLRGTVMLLRWRSGAWQSKGLLAAVSEIAV